MNGPEHYREAERLIAAVNNLPAMPAADMQLVITAAQVHATLAAAAAVAVPLANRIDWNTAAGVPCP